MFDINLYINKALKEIDNPGNDSYGNEKALILSGIAKLYENTKNETYLNMLLEKIGTLTKEKSDAVAMCYGLDFTKKDEYKEAIKSAMQILNDSLNDIDDEMALVFYMKHETKVGGKEHYQDVVDRFVKANDNSQKNNSYFMLALIEALESVDQAVYEHYDVVKRLFKECLKNMLDEEEQNATEMALAGYAILKACRMRAILSEKYESIGIELTKAALDASEYMDIDMGACIIAYSEYMMHNQEV